MYVAEVAEPHLCGTLASLSQLMLVSGLVCNNGLSIHDAVRWNIISAILVAIPGLEAI